MVLPSITSTAPSVYFTLPPASLLKLPPDSNPQVLSPPTSDHTLSRPFNIDAETYSNALHFAIPVTIALVYTGAVTYFNRRNEERNYKPWAFSKTTAFYIFVVAHNTFLALYSGWTFVGMLNTIRQSWPGWHGEYGLAGVADALCKINGPRGLGSAATYNTNSNVWSYTDKAIKLVGGRPDSTDVGRIWNEGLAFYGWLFYISKFYEVIDTAIIISKGKMSGSLQTWHHAGAMICTWAGIRYMSPPIWMFVFINSALHAVMYTYYALSALRIRVPKYMKGLLTTLQITQIVVGCTYALAHLFIAYDIPTEIPYLFVHNLSTALPSTASTLSSALSSAVTSATAAAGISSWLKKAALRAAGEEGLAENVRNDQGETFGIDALHAAGLEKAQEEIRYRMGTQRVHCLNTSGEAFAILINAAYLIPLFYFFAKFYRESYVARAKSEPPKPTQLENIKESSKDAIKEIEREIEEAMANEQGGTTEPPPELRAKLEKAKSDAKKEASDLSDKAHNRAKDLAEKTKEGANDLSNKAKDATDDLPAKAQKGAQDLSNQAKDAAGDLPEKVQNGVKDGVEKAKDLAGDIPSKAKGMGEQAKEAGKDAKQSLQEDLQALQEKLKKEGGERPKSSGKEKNQPNGDTKSRDRSPEKASKPRDPSPEKKAPVSRNKSPEKKPQFSREKSPEKKAPASRDKSPEKETPAPREKSPEKKAPTPRDPSPQKPAEPEQADEPKKEPEEEKKSSPDLGASGYEIVPDEPKTEEERKAEEEMQPKQE